jgi:hypothetical protein
MCIGKGAKVAGMEGNDKCFEIFVKPGRVKLVSWRNCIAQKFSVQDVHHRIVDGEVLGARSIIAPTRDRLLMQEHRQQQASMGQTPSHFWHMLKLFAIF